MRPDSNLAVALALVMAGCSRDDAAAAPKPAATSAAVKPAKADGCSPSAFRSDKYGFCVEMPADYQRSTSDTPGDDQGGRMRSASSASVRDSNYGEIDIEVTANAPDSDPWQVSLYEQDKQTAGRKLVEETPLPGGGHFMVQTGKGINIPDYTFVHSVVRGARFSVGCTGGGDTAARTVGVAAAKQICKSLRAL